MNRRATFVPTLIVSLLAATIHLVTAAPRPPEYEAIRQRLARGWNTWNSRSVLSWSVLPEGFGINLAFKQVRWLDDGYLSTVLIGRGEGHEQVRPGPHTYDGRYTRLDIAWEELDATVETAHVGEDLVVLVTPRRKADSPVKLVIESATYWNRPGKLSQVGDRHLRAQTPDRTIDVFSTADHQEDYYVETSTPYLVLSLESPVGISTGTARDVGEIRRLIDLQKHSLEQEAQAHGDLSEAYVAVQSGIAWNTIYEPRLDRVVSTVGRLWNEEYGGYCLFGWDNFFLAYMTSLTSRDLAYANVIEHLAGATEEGFIPNDNRGNGSKSWDRSQPPVGSLMVREIYRRYPERWFLEAVFEPLLAWNRWWPARRDNRGLLSYGSHPAKNPFNEPATQSRRTAGYESGMDDSPMYDGVPFDTETYTLALQDVGLTSLVIADSEALAEMADLLGRGEDARELRDRAAGLRRAMEEVWDEGTGLYLNRRTDTGELSRRLSPTLFYPLLAGVPSEARAKRMVAEHLFNPDEFWGPWVLPSIARNDPDFARQRYWKGAIWPPLNFLTYLGLRKAGFPEVAGELSEKSLDMFVTEWLRKGYVSENYSSIGGTGDDERLSSDRFHSWGALFGIMAFVEAGALAAPEAPLPRPVP
jgi:putative isomerase